MKNKKVKKIVILSILSVLILAIIVLISMYFGNIDFRYLVNKNILKKELGERDLSYIDLNDKGNSYIFAYGKNVAVLNENVLTIYNDSAKKISEIEVSVSAPVYMSKDNYLALSDENSGNVYLIRNDSLIWKKTIEGNVSQIAINKQGEVAIVVTGTTYKSVIEMFDYKGEEVFKTFLSTNYSTDVSLSDNGNYLSFVEVDTSGTSIVSKIKTISIDKAKESPSEAIINNYSFEKGELVVNIEYVNNDMFCMADNAVYVLKDGNINKKFDINDKISFVDVDLNGYACRINDNAEDEKHELEIYNENSDKPSVYLIDEAVKNIYCNNRVVAVNLGNEVDFVNMSGWLIKRFTPLQNIKDIEMGNGIAAIVYKDRVEFLKL